MSFQENRELLWESFIENTYSLSCQFTVGGDQVADNLDYKSDLKTINHKNRVISGISVLTINKRSQNLRTVNAVILIYFKKNLTNGFTAIDKYFIVFFGEIYHFLWKYCAMKILQLTVSSKYH